MRRLPTYTLCLLSAALPAVELVIRDFNASIALLPTSFDYELTGANNTTSSDSDAFSSGIGLQLGATYSLARTGSRHGLIFGIEGGYELYGLDAGDGSMHSISARLLAGYGLALSDRFQVMLTPYAGYGLATLDIPTNDAFNAISGDGDGFTYGVRFSLQVPVSRRLSTFATLNYQSTSTDISGNGLDLTIDQTGLGASIGIAWRWDDIPALLDQ
jgi:hypothetical protein